MIYATKNRLAAETFTHEEIGKLFNCSRQNIEKEYKKHKEGVKDSQCLCLLNPNKMKSPPLMKIELLFFEFSCVQKNIMMILYLHEI